MNIASNRLLFAVLHHKDIKHYPGRISELECDKNQ